MADILQITLPDGTTYNIKDNNALPLIGGQVTGPVTFGSSVSIDDLTAGNVIITGNASFVQGIPWSTITDAPTTISGYGITDAVTNVAYDSSTYNITKTINGTTSSVYQMPCIAGTGTNSFIAGNLSNNIASGHYAFAAGDGAQASANGSVALASGIASQTGAIAIGNKVSNSTTTTASGIGSVAIGTSATASGLYTIALGYKPVASAAGAIAIGAGSIANANFSLAFGAGTKASSQYQTTMGKYNIEDNQDTYAFILGNGTADDARSNVLTVDWNGNESLAGGLTLGKDTANEATLTAQQLNVLLPLVSSGLITDANGTARKIYLTTTEAVPSGAVTGDIVFVKVT